MRRTAVLLLALALLLSACSGGGDDGAAGDDEVGLADPAATGLPSPTPAQGPTENPKDEAELDLGATAAPSAGASPSEAPPPSPQPPTEEPPPEPTGPPTEGLPGGRYVQIDEITAEGNSYAVSFTPFNFTPLIGTGPQDYHIHFFWNTLEPQNAGTNGPDPGDWFLYDGASPFNGWTFGDRPPEATQMCALVADAAHGVTVGSGNCVTLP